MKLIETGELLKEAKIHGWAGESAAKVLILLSRLNRINKIYARHSDLEGSEFIDAMLYGLGINFEVPEKELELIPGKGPFITVSNHPFGGIDELLLLKLIRQVRPDYKLVPDFLLQKIPNVRESLISPEPRISGNAKFPGIGDMRRIKSHLEEGKGLGIFPAGKVSSFNQDGGGISDRQWNYQVLKMIKRARVPVVPIYFRGSNSRLFHILGLIHPTLQTVKLPTEMFNKKKKTLYIRISSPIPVREQDEFTDISRYGRFLRTKTYALGTSLEVKKFFLPGIDRPRDPMPVIDAVPVSAIRSDLQELDVDHKLFSYQEYDVYCAPSVKLPNIINEIGRLREITFREVGEGTNKSLDIDEFDLYFHQLFIWDRQAEKIVGAYRVGKGKEIVETYGIKGFYVHSLFRMNKKLIPVLRKSLELGRSFITGEYQRKPMPLFLLWKGILYFLIKNPEYRYLIGPVSISNRYSNFSKGVIINFIKDYYYNYEIARYIKPRKKFRVPVSNLDTDILFEKSSDLNKLDKFIRDIERTHFHMPVLLKKYLRQSGRIIGFNIDPAFNNALDGLMILDLFDVPMETISTLSKEINDESLLERFSVEIAGKSKF